MYDLVIRNGTVVDGSGLAPYPADVATQDGRIVSIGRIRDSGREEIDAEGHVVTPGFIDLHTHMDAQVFWDRLGTCSCWHGVTTVLMGNCGFTLAPSKSDDRSLVIRNIQRSEAIDRTAMEAGIDWSWETFPEYLDAVDRLPKGINYAALVGHSALRTWVMGEEAFAREAEEPELREMQRLLGEAIGAGAWGFSSSRTWAHMTPENQPVASRLASWQELCELVGVMGDLGAGIFEIGQERATFSRDPAERAEFNDRLQALVVQSGVPTLFGVLPSKPASDDQLAMLDATAAAGGRAAGMSHSRGISIILSFQTQLPFDTLPEWSQVRSLDQAEQRRLFTDPTVRERLVREAHDGDYARAAAAEARRPNFNALFVVDGPFPPYRTVTELAAERDVDPVELMIDLALESDFDQLFMQPASRMEPAEVLEIMKHPRTVMTFSDSGAHVSQIMDSSIHTHFLAYWVRERQEFTLEEAIRMITLAPAVNGGFSDRGLLREGLVADVNVFDPDRIAPDLPVVAHDLPSGATRLKQTSTGILATVVGGQVVLRNGQHTGALPGRLVRGRLAAR
jgi:N-acyl-D-amino-acid deacylase